MRIAAAMLVAALVAGPAAAQSTSPSNLKPETNCTIAPDTTRSGDDQNSSSMGLLGGGRLGWPADCGEDDVPAWLVFGAMLRAADMMHERRRYERARAQ